jgi:hypothetical protein
LLSDPCFDYINQSTVVFGNTRERAYQKLDEIIKEIDKNNIKSIRKGLSIYQVILFNGESYEAISTSMNARGFRCGKAYVDMNIPIKLIKYIIEPCLRWSRSENPIIYFE